MTLSVDGTPVAPQLRYPADFVWETLGPRDRPWVAAFAGKAWAVETAVRLLAAGTPVDGAHWFIAEAGLVFEGRVPNPHRVLEIEVAITDAWEVWLTVAGVSEESRFVQGGDVDVLHGLVTAMMEVTGRGRALPFESASLEYPVGVGRTPVPWHYLASRGAPVSWAVVSAGLLDDRCRRDVAVGLAERQMSGSDDRRLVDVAIEDDDITIQELARGLAEDAPETADSAERFWLIWVMSWTLEQADIHGDQPPQGEEAVRARDLAVCVLAAFGDAARELGWIEPWVDARPVPMFSSPVAWFRKRFRSSRDRDEAVQAFATRVTGRLLAWLAAEGAGPR